MATLSAMFKLYDRYSSTITKVIEKTDRAAQSILGASKQTDGFNDSLKQTDVMASRASSGITRLIGAVGGLVAAQKAMSLTDTYVNTNARLGLITNGLEEQKALQQDIFAAADRARGDYTEMANAAAKLKMLAGDSFGSNQEAVGFTELLTKSLKISGAGRAEQNSAFLQLTQAMTSGKLQGDEFRSVMENAPMVANAIAEYMGVTKGELKELSSKGVITADIIKNAMFSAADDINGKFGEMPMTFGDIWNRIKNAGMNAFGGVFTKLNQELNSAAGQQALSNIITGIYMAANYIGILIDGAMWFYRVISENWGMLSPVVMTLVGAFVAYQVALGLASGAVTLHTAAEGIHNAALARTEKLTFLATMQQYGFNTALLACPITWLVGGLLLLVGGLYLGTAAFNHFAGTSISATGLIVGALFTAGAFVGNLFIGVYNLLIGLLIDGTNLFISFCEFLTNVFYDPIFAIKNLFADLANFVLGVMQSLASAIDAVFGQNLASAVGEWSSRVDAYKQDILTDKSVTFDRGSKSDAWLDRINYGSAFQKGYGIGSSAADIASLFDKSILGSGSGGIDFSQFATAGNPAVIKGTGNGGSVKVENEEDIEWMRKLAERDYVARISQNTLAPNIRVEFTGPITKEADTDGVAAHMAEQLKEIIASAPEGVYP